MTQSHHNMTKISRQKYMKSRDNITKVCVQLSERERQLALSCTLGAKVFFFYRAQTNKPWRRGCTYTTVLQSHLWRYKENYHRGSLSDNHHFIIITRWQIIRVSDILYSQTDWLRSEPKKPLSQERGRPEAFSCAAPRAARDSDG